MKYVVNIRNVALLTLGATSLTSCQMERDLPPRFDMEEYRDCIQMKQVLNSDYVALAIRRFAKGKNVFLYRISSSESFPPAYSGIKYQDGRMSNFTVSAIKKGGSWGVKFPDTGCSNIPRDFEEEYIKKYNQFSLTLYKNIH